MENDHAKKGLSTMAKNYKEKADGIQVHVNKMKEILFASQKSA
jgi:two-component system chemotaxis response regulator CheB